MSTGYKIYLTYILLLFILLPMTFDDYVTLYRSTHGCTKVIAEKMAKVSLKFKDTPEMIESQMQRCYLVGAECDRILEKLEEDLINELKADKRELA